MYDPAALWPHYVAIPMIALVAACTRRPGKLVVCVAVTSCAAPPVYRMLGTEIMPPHSAHMVHLIAAAVSVVLPLVVTGVAGYAAAGEPWPRTVQVCVATMVGGLTLGAYPAVQLVLGCGITGICP